MKNLPAILLLLALPCLPARAQDRYAGMGGFLGPVSDSAAYLFTAAPAQRGGAQILRQEAEGTRVLSKSPSDTWSVSGQAGLIRLGAPLAIPVTGTRVPEKLWNVQAGGAFARRLAQRRAWGASLGAGSASDEPFRSIHETTARATVYGEWPSRERDSWLLFLNYSNNRSFLNNVPLPGAAYVFREPAPGLRAIIGLPFVSLDYRPTEGWRASLSVIGPTNASAEVSRRLRSEAWAYARYARDPSQWSLAGRTTRSDRLIFDRQEARAGLRLPLGAGLSADLSAGREFGRRFFEGRDAQHSDGPKAELPAAWTGALRLSWRR